MRTRPIVPPLFVYKLEPNMVLSIGHRITGSMLLAIMYLFSAILLLQDVFSVSCGFHSITFFLWSHLEVFMILYGSATIYHFLTGLRHLLWDSAKGLNIGSVDLTGHLIVVAATISFLMLCLIFL